MNNAIFEIPVEYLSRDKKLRGIQRAFRRSLVRGDRRDMALKKHSKIRLFMFSSKNWAKLMEELRRIKNFRRDCVGGVNV